MTSHISRESGNNFLELHWNIPLKQWFVTFFAPRTPKLSSVLPVDHEMPVKEFLKGTILYYCVLRGPL